MNDLRKEIRKIIESLHGEANAVNERMLSFPDKTMMPKFKKEQLPYHAPVTTNLPHPNRKNKSKSKKPKSKKKINEVSDEQYDFISSNYPKSRIILSNDDEINFRSRKEDQRITYKPKGLWYGFGTSWADWVIHEMPDWRKDYDSVFLLEINESSVLQMRTKKQLLEFTKKYSPKQYEPYSEKNLIDWTQVVKDYDGIEIIPYVKSARMDERTNWYYPWDVASGCIWSAGGIRSIKKIS